MAMGFSHNTCLPARIALTSAGIQARDADNSDLAGGDRIKWNLVAIRRAHDGLHLLDGVRSHGRGWNQLVRLILDVREVVAIGVEIVIAREHPVAADRILRDVGRDQ